MTYFKLNEDGTLEISGSNGDGFESFDTLPRHDTLAPDECYYYNKATITIIGTEDVVMGQDADGIDIIEVHDVTESTWSVEIDYDAMQNLYIEKLIEDGEALVSGYIQNIVNEFNTLNKTRFGSVYNCNIYVGQSAYPHQQFCIDIVAFNALVWDTARANQATAITEGWDEAKFLASLPQFGV